MVLKGREYACQRRTKYKNWLKCGQKQGDSVPMYMCSNVIPARGEESSGSHFHHMVPVTKDVHMQALRKV